MRLLIDMNLSTDWVAWLATAGQDAIHWSSIGAPDAGDWELLDWARFAGAAILTNDLDFGIELVTKGLSGPSVIQLRSNDLRPSTLGKAVMQALAEHDYNLQHGVLITIDPVRSRFRLLELGQDER